MVTNLNAEMLAEYTTLRVGGRADKLVLVESETELIKELQAADLAGEQVLLLGSGSNLVVADDGFRGTVIAIRSRGFSSTADACGGAIVDVQAGQNWDEFVAECVAQKWSGLEALSGIPGTVGATPIQNVGAYGQEVGSWIYRIRAYDRTDQQIKTFMPSDCGFGYRDSIFKQQIGRYAILEVSFQLRLGDHSAPVMYGELADRLGIEVGKRSKISDVRNEVLRLRASKGMVLAEFDHDTWSAGSFFTNPIVAADVADRFEIGTPAWPQPDGRVKLSAAWLVEKSGIAKGFALNERAGVSGKHSLALTNRGDATAEDVLELARHIQHSVHAKFGIALEIEPQLVGEFE